MFFVCHLFANVGVALVDGDDDDYDHDDDHFSKHNFHVFFLSLGCFSEKMSLDGGGDGHDRHPYSNHKF